MDGLDLPTCYQTLIPSSLCYDSQLACRRIPSYNFFTRGPPESFCGPPNYNFSPVDPLRTPVDPRGSTWTPLRTDALNECTQDKNVADVFSSKGLYTLQMQNNNKLFPFSP